MFYARESQIVVLQSGTFRTCYGSGDYLQEPINYQTKPNLFYHLLRKHGVVDFGKNDFPVVSLIPMTWTRKEKEDHVKFMFETCNVPGLYLLDQPVGALYGCGMVTGCVIDLGHSSSTVTCIIDSVVVNTITIPVGGKDVDDLLQLKLSATELLKIKQHLKCPLGNIHEIKEVKLGDKSYSVSNKVFDVLFDPSLVGNFIFILGKKCYSIQEALFECITARIEPSRRVLLWENIILTGGICELEGIQARLESEILSLCAVTETSNEYQPKEIKYISCPEYMSAYKDKMSNICFLGGVVVGKLVFGSGGGYGYYSKQDYNEHGPNIHLFP